MRKWLNQNVKRYMIRPIIYKSSSRFAYLLTLALLWDRFISQGTTVGLSAAFGLIGIGFLLATWLAWLRIDGVRIPRLPARTRKPPKIDSLYGDMIDHVDEPITDYADLDANEQNVCLMLSDAICAVLFGVISLFV